MNPFQIPTGNDTAVVKAYYDYLMQYHLGNIPINRATNILWVSPVKVFAWWLVLVTFFFLYAYFFNRAHRRKGDMYGATSFAGSLLERNGIVTVFTWFVIIGLFLSGLYLGIKYIFEGFLY